MAVCAGFVAAHSRADSVGQGEGLGETWGELRAAI